MTPFGHTPGWRRMRALVLAAVVLVGGFGLPAFDAIAFHWRPPASSPLSSAPKLQQFGAPLEHSVQCVITHNAPAPRLAAVSGGGLRLRSTERVSAAILTPATPRAATIHSPVQPRAPPVRIA